MSAPQVAKTRSLLRLEWAHCALLAVMLSFPKTYAAAYDSYGGWLALKGKKTGFFHTEQIHDRWWLVSPEGNSRNLLGTPAFAGLHGAVQMAGVKARLTAAK